MAHDESLGHGSVVQRSSDKTSGGSFATVGTTRDLVPPSLSRDPVKSTDMASPDRWHEYIGGMKDGGELSFEITFDPGSAETTAFLADLNDDDPGYYKIVYPDATEWGFPALLTGFDPQVPVEDKMVATITFKLSGKPGFIA